MASAADVVSKNVVGLEKISMPANQYTPLGWQFAIVNGPSNMPIAAITNYSNPTQALAAGGSDTIRRFNSGTSSWTDYFNRTTGWRKVGETTNTADAILVGEMVMFLKRNAASDLFQSGEVIPVNMSIALPANQYTAMCNPFPVELSISSVTNYTNPTQALAAGGSDTIRRFNSGASTWTDYFNRTTGWRKVGETTNTADTIKNGEGFMFLKRTTAGTITLTTPL